MPIRNPIHWILTQFRIPFAGANGTLDDDPALVWDDTNKRVLLASTGQTLETPETGVVPQIHAGGDSANGVGSILLDGYGAQPTLTMRRIGGTQASKSALTDASIIFNFRAAGYDGSASALGGLMRMIANGDWSGSNHGEDFLVLLTANASAAGPTERFRVTSDGISVGLNAATAGSVRVKNATAIMARNAANSADLNLITTNSSNKVDVGDINQVCSIIQAWDFRTDGTIRPVNNGGFDVGDATHKINAVYTEFMVNPPATITTTGTQAAITVTSSWVRANNASLLTLQGITAGADGQELEISSVGAGNVDLNNQNGTATAVDRIITNTGATVTLTAGTGRARLRYDGTTQRWRIMFNA